MAKKKSNPKFSKPDPRLKSFLRKAAAIIAAEKGLNAESHAKLQTLADRDKLPAELFEQALTLLQDNPAAINLSHYEKAFVKFLDREFEQVKSDIISPRSEQEAIKQAKQKYDIGETRAQQLISVQAKAAGKELISPQDALDYADRSIVDQISDAIVIEGEQRDQLFKFGFKWGLSESQVTRIITRHTSQNRIAKRRKMMRPLLFTALIVISAAATGYWAYSNDWISQWTEARNAPGKTDETPESIPVANLTRFSDAAFNQIRQASESSSEIGSTTAQILSNDKAIRRVGYQQLVRIACSHGHREAVDAQDLVTQFYYSDPDEESIREIVSTVETHLRASYESEGENSQFTVQNLRNSYHANSLLWKLWNQRVKFTDSKLDLNGRRAEVERSLAAGFELSSEKSNAQRLRLESETEIAKGQWNALIQRAWANPTQSAVVMPALLRLTQSKLDPTLLETFRDDAVATILQTDSTQWRKIRAQMNASITSCEDFRLNDWVSIFESSKDQAFQVEIGKQLLARLGITANSNRHFDIESAVSDYALRIRNQQLQPVILRAELLDEFYADSIELDSSPALASPDRIAQIAFAVNVESAFCAAIENASHIDDSSFSEFDRLIALPLPRLQELISLPSDDKTTKNENQISATASDRRRLDAAIERLGNSNPDASGLRILALKQLKQISHRFERISYAEANTIATFLLSDLTRDELLGVQLILESFSHWPNLSLAVADALPESNVQADQALTVLRLLLGREIQLPPIDDWKRNAQVLVIGVVAEDVANQVDQDPDNVKSNWARLKIFLTELYRERLAATSNQRYSQSSSGRTDQLITKVVEQSLVRQRANKHGMTDANPTDIQRSIDLLNQTTSNEIEKTAFANQLLCSVLTLELKDGPARRTASQLIHDLENTFKTSTNPGDRLYASELSLLKFMDLRRRKLVEGLLNQENDNE